MSSARYAMYDSGGRITRIYGGDFAGALENLKDGESVLQITNAAGFEHYVANSQVFEKTPLDLTVPEGAIDEDITMLIPVGSRLRWPDWVVTEELDGEFTFQTPVAGAYVFEIDHPRHIVEEVTIHVT